MKAGETRTMTANTSWYDNASVVIEVDEVSTLQVTMLFLISAWIILVNLILIVNLIVSRDSVTNPVNLQILTLSVTDTLIGVSILPQAANVLLSSPYYYRSCTFILVSVLIPQTAALFHMLGLCIHRAFAANRNSSPQRRIQRYMFAAHVVIPWTMAGLFILTMISLYGVYGVNNGKLPYCSLNILFGSRYKQAMAFLSGTWLATQISMTIAYLYSCTRLAVVHTTSQSPKRRRNTYIGLEMRTIGDRPDDSTKLRQLVCSREKITVVSEPRNIHDLDDRDNTMCKITGVSDTMSEQVHYQRESIDDSDISWLHGIGGEHTPNNTTGIDGAPSKPCIIDASIMEDDVVTYTTGANSWHSDKQKSISSLRGKCPERVMSQNAHGHDNTANQHNIHCSSDVALEGVILDDIELRINSTSCTANEQHQQPVHCRRTVDEWQKTVLITIGMLMVAMNVCVTPFSCTILTEALTEDFLMSRKTRLQLAAVLFLNSVLNPFIYATRIPRIRQSLSHNWTRMRRCVCDPQRVAPA